MNPKVSVILSVYNSEKYIKEAILSILTQSYSDFELIIIDDGSTDKTALILDEFNDERIVRTKNDLNLGLIGSLNKGIQLARGEFVARMDADDISELERLAKQVAFLDAHPEVGVLGTGMRQVDRRGRFVSFFTPKEDHRDILHQLLIDTAIAHATVMIRKNLLSDVGGYDLNFPHTEDAELWSRLVMKTSFANLREPLYVRRLHGDSIMSLYGKFQEEQTRKIREKLLDSLIQKGILNADEAARITAIQKKEHSLLKKVESKLKYMIPASIRHKIRHAFGKFFT